MANELKMAIVESILQLRALNWSARRIARHLGVDRGTVRKHLRRAGSASKPAIPPAGSPGISDGLCIPSQAADAAGAASVPAASPKRGRPSDCEPYWAIIEAKLELELSAQRIFQDLLEQGFAGGYDSVKRFVRQLGQGRVLPFRRMECAPGLGKRMWGRRAIKGPAGNDRRGPADILPPRSGYPSSGCSPAEPDSVFPDPSSIVDPFLSHHLTELLLRKAL
jgi:hypothetical protein